MMINQQLLDDAIRQSGLKKSFLAEKLGVSRQTFDAYIKKGDMKLSQVNALCEALGIEDPVMREAIFFDPDGAL